MEPKVFISYSRKDIASASFFVNYLRKSEIKCFIDYNMPIGLSFHEVIKNQIDKADIILVLLTESSKSSDWVQQEIGIALGLKKYIIPINFQNQMIKPNAFIARNQIYDRIDWRNIDHSMQEFLEALKNFWLRKPKISEIYFW